jgi:hypothetical protein
MAKMHLHLLASSHNAGMSGMLDTPIARAQLSQAGDDPALRAIALEHIIIQHESQELLDRVIRRATWFPRIVMSGAGLIALTAIQVYRIRRHA